MPAIGAFLLGLLLTFGGYRVLRLAARLVSAALFAAAAGYFDLGATAFWLSALLGWLLGDALYYLVVFLGGAAGGVLLGFAAAGEVGLAAGVTPPSPETSSA